MAYEDKIIQCIDCGKEFTFNAEEQELFAQRGYENEPKRCMDCRAAKKQRRTGDSYQPREMFPAVCATCGKDTEVPFQPRQDRPVYCWDCYNKERENRQ